MLDKFEATEIFINQKLNSIFQNYNQDKTLEVFKDDLTGNARFVHYTSASAAIKIINSKRLWMRNAISMSDYQEIQFGYSAINEFFKYPDNKQRFISLLERCHPGLGTIAIKEFTDSYTDIVLGTYILSISEHEPSEDNFGRLSMWRAFSRDTSGVALVFNVPSNPQGADELSIRMYPVRYLKPEEAPSLLNDVLNRVEENIEFLKGLDISKLETELFHMFLSIVTCTKHIAFQEEKEWRIIFSPQLFPSELMESSIEIVDGIPQNLYKIPLDSDKSEILNELDFSKLFDSLIIGPTQYPISILQAFNYSLRDCGVDSPRINISNIPIRQ